MSENLRLKHIARLSWLNYILLALIISLSILSHVIANRLILIKDVPIIPSSFTYMAVFAAYDLLSCFNNRKMVIFSIIVEAIVNLVFIVSIYLVNNADSPAFFSNAASYRDVFSSIYSLYVANLIGSGIAFTVDTYVFSYLFLQMNKSFFSSSMISTLSTIIIYTYTTDYFAFVGAYPHHVFELATANVITNLAFSLLFAIIGQVLISIILKKIQKKLF